MALDLTKIFDFAAGLLDTGSEFVESKVEFAYGAFSLWLDSLVANTDTVFDDKAKKIVELGIRDKLIKKYPLEDFPLD